MKMKPFHEKDFRPDRARLDTTTKPAADSLSPRRRSGEGQGEGISKERDNSVERAPLPSPLPARASQGEGPLQRWWVYQDAPPPVAAKVNEHDSIFVPFVWSILSGSTIRR